MADLRLKGDGSEKIVGAGHPSLSDTVNRLALAYHDVDGTHKDGLSIGGVAGSLNPTIRKCSINSSTGEITPGSGPDLMLNSASTASPDQQIVAYKLWASVFNDIADHLPLEDNEHIEFGKAYVFNDSGKLKISSIKCQKGTCGISTNQYGISTGINKHINTIPISIGGIVNAYIDKKYKTGTALISGINGILTKANFLHKIFFPERIIGIYVKYISNNEAIVKVK